MERVKLDDVESAAPLAPAAYDVSNGHRGEPAATAAAESYRSIPEQDVSGWHRKDDLNNFDMGKLNDGNVEGEDGADEKMLNDETNIALKQPSEVKFISDNGDAKIDIEEVKKTMCGMGKEELMKYANDPFWIRLRWILFVGFWLIWLGMLAGAIAIIVMAPRCSAPVPKKWWQSSPIVQLDSKDMEGRDAQSIELLLTALQGQHVKVLSLSNFVDANGHTTDFRDVQSKVGGMATLETIVKAANERDQRVVLELDPNHSSLDHPWFNRSAARDGNYTDYYVWADPISGSSGPRKPPNNWLSLNGGSAWEWNDQRGQYYLHQFNVTQPDLNFNNPAVVDEFGKILNHWLDRGVSGFRLRNTGYLTEDPTLRDEKIATAPANSDEYNYLTHVHTFDRPQNGLVLGQWRDTIANRTNGDGLFALSDNIGPDILALYKQKPNLIDLPQRSQFLENADETITADILFKGVSESTEESHDWPGWDVNGNNIPLRKRMPTENADSIVLMTLLLPGTPILKVNDTLSAKEAFATIANARSVQTFSHGDTEKYVMNETVFVYTRVKSGNPGYLVAYQSANVSADIDLSKIKFVSPEVNILAHSPNYVQDGKTIETKLPADRVPISAKSTLVVTFVPKK